MEYKEFVLKDFKEYLPLDVDITDKERLVYRPILVSTELKKKIEPSLTEEQLYIHMKENSKWIFMFKDDVEYFKQDCIDFLRDIDFQSFSQYGKLTERNYRSAKIAYLFDSYLRNFLQELLERIEVFLKKSTADAITIGYNGDFYIFNDDSIYYSDQQKYSSTSPKRTELIQKTKYHLSRLVIEKKDDPLIKQQLDEYGVVLPWTLFRIMTFGNLSSFLIALQPDYRNKVANYISIDSNKDNLISAKLLLSWTNSLRYLRNLCSHNSRLYKKLHNIPPKIHFDDREIINGGQNMDKSLFVYFLVMKRIICCMSRESQHFWNNKVKDLDKESSKREIELLNYGFPTSWLIILTIDLEEMQ